MYLKSRDRSWQGVSLALKSILCRRLGWRAVREPVAAPCFFGPVRTGSCPRVSLFNLCQLAVLYLRPHARWGLYSSHTYPPLCSLHDTLYPGCVRASYASFTLSEASSFWGPFCMGRDRERPSISLWSTGPPKS